MIEAIPDSQRSCWMSLIINGIIALKKWIDKPKKPALNDHHTLTGTDSTA